ncbi:MAG: hypothetical protein GXO13_04590, partial [Epsilonproteobacteria bacterium]|nr:hypothetical protein [Campylobacterota bacterium]
DLNRQEEVKRGIGEIFEIGEEEFQEKLREKMKRRENLLLFLDMFEFWHTTLKEV